MADVDSTFIDDNAYSPYYLSGAAITLASTTFVLATFAAFPKLRKHPSPLLFWMSVCDLLFALSFVIEFVVRDATLCFLLSPITQISVLASELFFAMHAVDLVYCLTHPFTLDSLNMRKYHVFVWATSLVSGLLLVSVELAGSWGIGFCWIRENEAAWALGLLAVPIGAAYLFSIAVLIWAARRLRRGMPATFATRLRVLYKLRTTVAICSAYMVVLVLFLLIGVFNRRAGRILPGVDATAAITLSARGLPNALVWIFTRDVLKVIRTHWHAPGGGEGAAPAPGGGGGGGGGGARPSLSHKDSVRAAAAAELQGDASINYALRTELLQATSEGIAEAVRRAADLYDSEAQRRRHVNLGGASTIYSRTRAWLWDPITRYGGSLVPGAGREHVDGAGAGGALGGGGVHHTDDPPNAADYDLIEQHVRGVTDFANEVIFHDYAPRIFHSLRRHFGIDEHDYIEELSGSRRERFSEGKSGAFLYFSSSGRYIVKTTSKSEASDLMRLLPEYHAHVLAYPSTLLLRYVGLHAITLYGQKVHFVVMESVFATDLVVHERYDLKGSWVGRRATKSVDKRRGVRTMKNSEWPQFTSTPLTAGFREVRKDLDLQRPLILHPTDAYRLASQLKLDAQFLAAHRIMDYSLLLGIHNQHFRVKTKGTAAGGAETRGGARAASGPVGGGGGGGAAGSAPPPITASGSVKTAALADSGGGGAAKDVAAGRSGGGSASQHSTAARRRTTVASAASQHGASPPRRRTTVAGAGGRGEPTGPPLHRAHDGGVRAVVVEGPGVYFMGIIDILQTFTVRKRCEYWVKRFVLRGGLGISCVPPELYARRFISNVVEVFIEPPADHPEAALPPGFSHHGAVQPVGRRASTGAPLMPRRPRGDTVQITIDADENLISHSAKLAGRRVTEMNDMPEVEPATPGSGSLGRLRSPQQPWYMEVASWFVSEPPDQRAG